MTAPPSIGRFQLRERLGSGGFATVWRARDPELDADVAVKILADNWVERSDIRERFLEEGRMLRRADSDRVVRVYDIGTLDDGRPYLVMSYADAGTLEDRLAAGPLPVPTALRYAAGIARGVAVLHEIGILHRDIKPSNILFASASGGERVMLADLGLAKAIAHASGLTLTAGTPGYMAPEQVEMTGGLDQRTDVYALGALTYQLLTGRQPERPRRDRPLPPPGAVRGTPLPPHTDELVLRALEYDKEQRWPDAAAFADAADWLLHQSFPGAPGAPVPPALPPALPPAPRPHAAARPYRWILATVAGCLVVALLAAAGVYGYRKLHPAAGDPTGSPSATASTGADAVHTYGDAIVFGQPRSWRSEGGKAPQATDLTETMTDFGVPGGAKGRILSSLPDFTLDVQGSLSTGTGVTVVVAKKLASVPWRKALAAPVENSVWGVDVQGCTHSDHTSANGKVHIRTFGGGCGMAGGTLRQVLSYQDGYAVEVFVVAPDGHADDIDAVVGSIRVDEGQLP